MNLGDTAKCCDRGSEIELRIADDEARVVWMLGVVGGRRDWYVTIAYCPFCGARLPDPN